MSASWTGTDRRARVRSPRGGLGTVVALVLWIVAVSFIYAVIQSQAQTGALGGVARVTSLKTVTTAGQSALAEAIHVVRHPVGARSPLLEALVAGRDEGILHEPEATREAYGKATSGDKLTIEPVFYKVVSRPPTDRSTEAYQIDVSARVRHTARSSQAPAFTRQVRQRLTGRLTRVMATMGPKEGQVVYSSLYIHPDPVVEVVEP
ncbi:MAG: hypothetical protein HY815_12715 [Candidatus Riflebacteria bacterium]|nr:hypothetical protein [Candidatus Riflebacteria bacterium]